MTRFKLARAVLIGIIFLPSFALALSSNVTKIEFSGAESNNVVPVSQIAKLHLDLCGSSGCDEKSGETSHLLLESTSATGEFSSSETNWEKVNRLTINSNWSGRNFYYRDSAAGTVTLRAKIEEKTDLTATWSITVGGSSLSGGTSSGSTSGGGTSGNSTDSGSSGESSHTGQEELSNYESGSFAIGVGRTRLVAAGSPVDFHIERKKGDIDVSTLWSFGDGGSANGEVVSHSYAFPGEYVVVANVSQGEEKAVARTKVSVIEPKVIITEINRERGYILLDNQSIKEINLGGWQMICGSSTSIFPRDTILEKGSKLHFPIFDWRVEVFAGCDLKRPDGLLSNRFTSGLVFGSSTSSGELSPRQRLVIERFIKKISAPVSPVESSSSDGADNQAVWPPLKDEPVDSTSSVVVLPRKPGLIGRFLGIIGL